MKVYGRARVSEYLGDRVVYRNLAPLDSRLPGLNALREELGLPPGRIPRKSEPEYAQVVAAMLRRARQLEAPGEVIKRLVFIGDTRLNDSTAFGNLCQAGGWSGYAFIGSETGGPAKVEESLHASGQPLVFANRWSALTDFDQHLADRGFAVDAQTAVVIDLDKTALGARGRNDHVIDRARVAAVRDTVAGMLGAAFDQAAFQQAYERLNRVEFHPFTTDNQDYLAYICLILGSGLYALDRFVQDVRQGRLASFHQFIAQVDAQADSLPGKLHEMHAEIYERVQAGDPTPFKPFRRNEYLATVGRMGQLSDEAPVEDLLAKEIVLTQEVRALAGEWSGRGALLFGLSDKPDEASIPTAELAAQGYAPIHQTPTHAVGV